MEVKLYMIAMAGALLLLGFAAGYILRAPLVPEQINNSTNNTTAFLPDQARLSLLKTMLEDYMFINSGTHSTVTYSRFKDSGSYVILYFIIDGQEMPVYLSSDMKYLIGKPESLEDTAQQLSGIRQKLNEEIEKQSANQTAAGVDAKKATVPTVELFVMSYCPYGLQAEKAIIPVVSLLGNKANISIKFVNYAMHPTYGEVQENTRQYCIQNEQNEKFWKYLACFVKDGNSEVCLNQSNVDVSRLNACMNVTDAQYNITGLLNDKSTWRNSMFPFYPIHNELNIKYNVQGSPTLVINGEQVNTDRSPEAMKEAICASFETAPEECQTVLSSDSMPPGFGYAGTGYNEGSCG